MKYKVSFTVTDAYPETEIEAKDRDEAVRLYQDLFKNTCSKLVIFLHKKERTQLRLYFSNFAM